MASSPLLRVYVEKEGKKTEFKVCVIVHYLQQPGHGGDLAIPRQASGWVTGQGMEET